MADLRSHLFTQSAVSQHLKVLREAGLVSVRKDGTRVQVIHEGWERFEDRAREVRDEYESGWNPVLERFAKSVGAAR